MSKKLPGVFAGKVNKNSGNNSNVYYSNHEDRSIKVDNRNINQKINDIFSSNNYIYKADVKIKLKNETINKRIVGKNSTHLITIDNELIPITDIVDIERVN